MPLLHSRRTVSTAVHGLSPYISPLTCSPACAPFTPSKSGQRLPPTYYRGCWHVVSRGLFFRYRHSQGISSLRLSSRIKEFYNPKAFITHAALLRQAFAHCGRFPTAASRRSLDRVSVPVWPFILSDRLLIVGLVGRYPTNYLIRRKPLFRRSFEAPFFLSSCGVRNSFGISSRFRLLSPSRRQVVYALLTRSPLNSKKASFLLLPFDLHVLSTPPAFVLSQDQTLHDRLFVWLDFVLPLKQISLSLLKCYCGIFLSCTSAYCSLTIRFSKNQSLNATKNILPKIKFSVKREFFIFGIYFSGLATLLVPLRERDCILALGGKVVKILY